MQAIIQMQKFQTFVISNWNRIQ